MLKANCVLFIFLLLACIDTSKAEPLESPDIVYIDGLPCNHSCQSYMAWSRERSQKTASAPLPPEASEQPSAIEIQPKINSATNRLAPAPVAKDVSPKLDGMPPDKSASLKLISGTKVKSASSETATKPQAGQETEKALKLVAPPLAVHGLTVAAPPLEQKLVSDANHPGHLAKVASLASANPSQLVAVLFVRADIGSASNLANKIVAIDRSEADSLRQLETAIVSAGATDVKLSEDKKLALLRVMDGEVPAGIVTVASPEEAATWKAGMPGFNVLRIPLAASPEKKGTR